MVKQIKRPDPDRARKRRRLVIAGLAVFFIIDAGLVALALAPRVEAPPRAPVVEASAAPRPEPTSQPTEPTVPVIATVSPTRILAARNAETAWRATTGPCGTPALPEITTDSGATWQVTSATAPTGVVSLQAIAVEGGQVASMIGQDPNDCTVMLVRTFVSGDNYAEYPVDLADAWFVNPVNRAEIHSPAGSAAAPCVEVVALAFESDVRAAALCADGSLHTTTDGSATWGTIDAPAGAMNLATAGAGYIVASVGNAGCAGVQLATFTDPTPELAAAVVPGACIASPIASDALAGQIALAEGDGALWMWAGDVLSKSTDGGSSWG